MAKSASKNTNTTLKYPSPENIYEIGIDEAGRGPLFGRVYAAAVILPPATESGGGAGGLDFSEIKDSKKFHSKVKLAKVAQSIQQHSIAWAVAYEEASTIDSMNILRATMKAMHECIRNILEKLSGEESDRTILLLVDGNYFTPYSYYDKDMDQLVNISHETVLQGDNTYYSIAAASILAKYARDTYIAELCEANPFLKERYKIHKNMGYGTKEHIEGIQQYGYTEWHRKSFSCKGITKN
jgi:ribonuclease HII